MGNRAMKLKTISASILLAAACSSAFATLSGNTSANTSTPAFSNGTLSGNTNVSKINVHTLLYAGNTTKVYVHWLPWFDGGNDSGIDVNYSTSDPTYVTGFLNDLVSRGVDGIMVDWQGQTDISNQGALTMQGLIHSYPSLKFT